LARLGRILTFRHGKGGKAAGGKAITGRVGGKGRPRVQGMFIQEEGKEKGMGGGKELGRKDGGREVKVVRFITLGNSSCVTKIRVFVRIA